MGNLYNINIFYQIVSINLFDKFFYSDVIYIIRRYSSFIRIFKKIFNSKNFIIRRKSLYYFNNDFSRRYFYLTNLSSLKINYKFNKFYFLKLFYLVSIITFNFLFIFVFNL